MVWNTYGWRASGARFELLKPYARSACKCQHKLAFLLQIINEFSTIWRKEKTRRFMPKVEHSTWFAKSATECTTSASMTWLELTNQTPNLREKTRKLHHNAVVTARWLDKNCRRQKARERVWLKVLTTILLSTSFPEKIVV